MRPGYCLFLIVLLWLGLAGFAHAMEPSVRFERFGMSDGLSQNTVRSIVEDDRGFYWIATLDGLNRYDGYGFKVYRKDANDPHSLSANHINVLHKDKSGRLWIGTTNGLNRYDPVLDRFVRIQHDNDNSANSDHNNIRGIAEDKNGLLWIATRDGLKKYDPQGGGFETFRHSADDAQSLATNRLRMVFVDSKNRVWVGTDGVGVELLEQRDGRFTHIRDQVGNRVTAITEDSQGFIWTGSMSGVTRLSPDLSDIRRFNNDPNEQGSLAHDVVITVTAGVEGSVYVGTLGGASKYDPKTDRFSHWRHVSADLYSLSDNSVWSILIDSQKAIWVGTNLGLNRYNTAQGRFAIFDHQSDNDQSLSHSNVMNILKDSRSRLWVATGSGLNRLDPGAPGFKRFKHVSGDAASLADDRVFKLFEDAQGSIWVGTMVGLQRYDEKSGQFTTFDFPDTPFFADPRVKVVTDIEQTEYGDLFISLYRGGVVWVKQATGEMLHYMKKPNVAADSISDNKVNALAYRDKVLWIGTLSGGLIRMDITTGVFDHFAHHADQPGSLANNTIYSVFFDKAGRLWAGTGGGGLNRFNPKQGTFEHFREQDGLSNDTIYSITQDRDGYLWLGTSDGLSRFDPDKGEFVNFDEQDGLQSNEFNLGAGFVDENGLVYLGGVKGFNRFDPSELALPNVPANIVLTEFLLSNQAVGVTPDAAPADDGFILSSAVDYIEQLQLTHKENIFAFDFTATGLLYPQKRIYSYRLQGWDSDWIKTDAKNRRATYTNIPAGDYVFEVKSADSHGQWSDSVKRVGITILPPWSKTWWAYLIYFSVTFGILGQIIYQQMSKRRTIARHNEELTENNIKLKASEDGLRQLTQELEQRVEARTVELRQRADTISQMLEEKDRLLANISHEFRTPLTLILGPLDNQLKIAKDEQSKSLLSLARANGQRLLTMVDQLLDIARLDDFKHQNPLPIAVGESCNFLVESFRPLAEVRGITLTFDNRGDDRLSLEMLPDALEKILSNLLSNALKYCDDNQSITLAVWPEGDDKVALSVEDTGHGMTEDELRQIFERFTRLEKNSRYVQGAGIGLALVKELVTCHHGTIDVKSQPGVGSTFTVVLPRRAVEGERVEVNQALVMSAVEQVEHDLLPAAARDITETVEPGESRGVILVVEDNYDMRRYIVSCLSEAYDCIEAADGQQGIEEAQQSLPDLIISDVMMPNVDGFELTAQLKADDLTSHIPIILLTAFGDAQSRHKGWQQKADEFLEKPFDAVELLLRVDNLLSIRTLLRQRYQREFSIPLNLPPTGGQSKSDGLHPSARKFIDQLEGVLDENATSEAFDISGLVEKMHISHSNLRRKLKSILDLTPSEALRNFRLRKAAELLLDGNPAGTVAHMAGFASHSYFSQCFKAQYDCSPSEYYRAQEG